jgi:hypothetical protein
VLAACPVRCTAGELFARLDARDDAEKRATLDGGYDLKQVLTTTRCGDSGCMASTPLVRVAQVVEPCLFSLLLCFSLITTLPMVGKQFGLSVADPAPGWQPVRRTR